MYYTKTAREFSTTTGLGIVLNQAIGRTVDAPGAEEIPCKPLTDTKMVVYPEYLVRSVTNMYKSKFSDVDKDIVLQAFHKNWSRYGPALMEIFSVMRKEFGVHIDSNDVLRSSIYRANLAEVNKMQQLVGAPLQHHIVTTGNHFSYATIPDGFKSFDWSWVMKAGEFMKSKGMARIHEFTMPVSTSQGAFLKSSRDTVQWRTLAKCIQALIASKCDSRATLEKVTSKLDTCFTDKGFDPVIWDFTLGLRRQASSKSEPVQPYTPSFGDGFDVVETSVAFQGRARGIFIPTELIKTYFKPFAEGIKKFLFQHSFSVAVHHDLISSKLHYIACKSVSHSLFNEDKEWLCFYDLSTMDQTSHRGLYNCYKQFCISCFDNFEAIEGSMFEKSGFVFAGSVYFDDIFRQATNARSTMSGQPDVTSKNNVLHLIAMSQCIGELFSIDPLKVFQHLIDPQSINLEGRPIMAHIHGDDTMIYLGEDPAIYHQYYTLLAQTGLKSSCERAPIFLKKTVFCLNSSDLISNEDRYLAVLNKMCSQFGSKKEDRVKPVLPKPDHHMYMRPIEGSIVKNRLGEYQIPGGDLLKLALLDTAFMLNKHASSATKAFWELLWNISDTDPKSEPLPILFDQMIAQTHRPIIVRRVLELAVNANEKAKTIASYLERLYYSSQEQIGDDTLATVYGSLFFDPLEAAEYIGLSSLTLDQLVDLAIEWQNYIIASKGMSPTISDDTMTRINAFHKMRLAPVKDININR